MTGHSASREPEAGETLLEILIAVAILGICFAAVLGGLGTAVRVSGIHRQQAYDTNYLRALAQSLQAQTFDPCSAGHTSNYSTANILPAGSGYTLSIGPVEHLNSGSFTTACPAVDELQRLTLTVTPPDSRAAEPVLQPLVILKRKP